MSSNNLIDFLNLSKLKDRHQFCCSSLLSFVICFVLFADACQVSAKFMTHSCRIGILLTRVKLVLTPGVQLGNHINDVWIN